MKPLISGHKGFIGRNLTSYLASQSIPFKTISEGLFHYSSDTFIHLSAATNVRQSIKDPTTNFHKNVRGTFNALNFATQNHIRSFIFTSSANAPSSLSPYLASKLASEAYCTAFRESYGLETHILRLSNVYGPYSEYKDSIIPKFIKSAIHHKPFYIYGDGNQTRDFIYVNDVVKAILSVSKPLTNVAFGSSISINLLVEYLEEASNNFLNYVPDIRHTGAVHGEVSKVSISSDIKPSTPLYNGINNTFKWFAENYETISDNK